MSQRQFLKYLPAFNFTIASAALYVQCCCLLPWHNELDSSFQKLRVQRDQENKLALGRLKTIETNIDTLDKSFASLKTQRNKENNHIINILDDISKK
jgi:hypothetical protein